MRLLITLARTYPLRSIIMVTCLAAWREFWRVSDFPCCCPYWASRLGPSPVPGTVTAESMGAADSALERLVADGFAAIGISPTVGVLLIDLYRHHHAEKRH